MLPTRLPSRVAAAITCGIFVSIADAQTTSASKPEEDTIVLSPFEVTSHRDLGYESTNTLSGTRTNEPLQNLPNQISVLNRNLLNDIGANDFFEAMPFMLSTEAVDGGPSGVGGSAGVSVNLRGIQTNWQSRDGFVWYVPIDTFNVERLESDLGASGQLYGDIAAGGVLNAVTKSAAFKNRGELQLRVDNWGQRRASLDVNRILVPQRWAVRANAVVSRGGDWRDGPHNDIRAIALANTIELGIKTRLRVNGEAGYIRNRVGHKLAIDGFSDYAVVTPGTTGTDVDPSTAGTQQQYSITATNAVGAQQSFNTTSTIGAAGANQQWRIIDGQLVTLESTASNIYRQTVTQAVRAHNAESVIPSEQQWWGPGAIANRNYVVASVFLNHDFTEKFRTEIAYNLQSQSNLTWSADTPTVRRDPNPFLPAAGGVSGSAQVANSHFNDLYIENVWTGQKTTNRVHTFRLTGLYDWGVTHWMTQRLIGTLTSRNDYNTGNQYLESLTDEKIASLGLTGTAATHANNRITRRYYLNEGNSDETLARGPLTDVGIYNLAGFNVRQRQVLNTASFNALGNYFDGRLRTSLGWRLDYWNKDTKPAATDAIGNVTFPSNFVDTQDIHNTAWNYGGVLNITREIAAIYNYSQTFVANGTGVLFNGGTIYPTQGDGFDIGLRFHLGESKVTASATYFEATNANMLLAGAVTGTAGTLTTPLGEIINILGATNSETGLPWTTGRDVQDRKTQGFEFALTANPLPNWTLRATMSITKATNAHIAPNLESTLDRMIAAVNASGGALTPANYQNTEAALFNLRDNAVSTIWRPVFLTRYSFTSGALRGVAIGGNYLWNDKTKVSPTYTTVLDASGNPVHGDLTRAGYTIGSYSTVSVFASYRYRLSQRRALQFQLNVNNVFDEMPRLGGYATGYYQKPRQFLLTTTLQF